MNNVLRLYEYDYDKPPLEDVIIHYGVKGMKWGVRKDKKRLFGSKRRKKKDKVYKSNEEAIAAKDLKYIQKHKDKFSTKELNQVMNRVEAETKLDKMAKQSTSKARKRVDKILKSKAFKAIASIAVIGALIPVIRFSYGTFRANPRRLPDKQIPYTSQMFKDFKNAITLGGTHVVKKTEIFKLFKAMMGGGGF